MCQLETVNLENANAESIALVEKGGENYEGGVAGVLGGSMIFRGVSPKSETTSVKQN